MGDVYGKYLQYIRTIVESDVNGWNFKSNPIYNYVLEHVSESEGREYLSEITTRFTNLYTNNLTYLKQLAIMNDTYGSPVKYEYSNFIACSPTNLRYILHSLLILSFMQECKLSEIDVVEIGGGYGGLCFYMYKLSHLFNITINTYSMFDLSEPRALQRKYLETLNITNVKYLDMSDYWSLKPNSFLISNYAYSEIEIELQQQYSNTVLKYTSHGFLSWNRIPLYEFIDNKHIISEVEYPHTSIYNYYVRFTPL